MKYGCAFIFSIVILSGCKNTIIDGSIPNGGIVDTTWENQPAMSLTFGPDTYNYTERQMSCEASNILDPLGNYYTIYANNGIRILQINVTTDSLRLQTYALDGNTGNIMLIQNPSYTIGELGAVPCQLIITSIMPGRISGSFSGVLLSPKTGDPTYIYGGFTNVLYVN